jgi:preprotein translocase subunit YajC
MIEGPNTALYGFFGILGILSSLLPLVLAIIVMRWVFILKRNSIEQVKQNEEMISLLKEIRNNEK